MTRRAIVGLLFLVGACSDDPTSAPPGEGVTPDGGGDAPELVTASEDCGPGTRAAVGTTSCVPVGTTTCAAGFEKDASGWGCAAVLPLSACTGATRPALGEKSCVPIGDCAGAYPPAGAIIVDPALVTVDATHVKTLTDAIAAANDGATIAFVDGEHVAPFVNITKDVTIVGRCAEKTKLVPNPGGTGGMRILSRVNVRNVTIAGMETAFELYESSAAFDLEDAVLEGSRGRAVFSRNGAATKLRRVVVRGTVARTAGEQTIAVLAGSGASIEIEDSAITGSFDGAIAATDAAAAHVIVKRSVVEDSTGVGIRVFEGAKLELIESIVRRAGGVGILALHRKSGFPEVTLTRSVVTDIQPVPNSPDEDVGTALNAAYGAILKVDDTTVSDARGIGVYVTEAAKLTLKNSVIVRVLENETTSGHAVTASRGSEVTIEGSALVDARGLGIGALDGSRAHVERSLVRSIGGAVSNGIKVGFGLNAASGGIIELVDSSIVDAIELAIGVSGENTKVTVDKSLLTRTPAAPTPDYGHGVLGAFGSVVDIRGSIVERQVGAALFYAGGGGTVTRSMVRGNAIGAHVQEGSTLVEAASAPETSTVPELLVTSDVQFVDNASRTGSGELPLPALATAP